MSPVGYAAQELVGGFAKSRGDVLAERLDVATGDASSRSLSERAAAIAERLLGLREVLFRIHENVDPDLFFKSAEARKQVAPGPAPQERVRHVSLDLNIAEQLLNDCERAVEQIDRKLY